MGKQAIVTGASKGLGKAFAQQLAAKGYDLLLIARSEKILLDDCSALGKEHTVKVFALPADLSDPNSHRSVAEWCHHNNFRPSVLINNAGYACWGLFDNIPLGSQQQMMQVNTGTLVNLTYGILPLLKKHKQSYIMNVASTAAFQAVPTMIVYAASKAFVRSFSRGLRYELRNTGVSVTSLSPGPVATNFIEQAGMQAMQETAKKFEMPADVVAKAGLRAMFKRKAECVPGIVNYLTVKASNIIPDSILEKIAANLYMTKLK